MKNVYDIRYEQNLIYVRSLDQDILPQRIADEIYQDTVIMIYLYYEDRFLFTGLTLTGFRKKSTYV